jgi:ATP-binding cassette subfamily C protein
LVLRDLSLSISAGQFVAFVGPSGSGKSTLFRLLMGFETPATGAVYFDGHDLAELDVRAVRRQIGVVLQNARLSTGSIFRNIVGEGTLTIADAWEAARRAGLDEDLKALPMGMHTVVCEGGGGLSGGQRQRLLIARAIVHKPRILLFDEATSALDNQTQAIVSQSLSRLNATRAVIAHRLSTVMHADHICVLDKGFIVETGTYDELMSQGGLFTQLAKRQLS